MKNVIVAIIRIYQKTFSFDHGPFRFLFPSGVCKFRPTCSEYGILSIQKHGVFFGTIKLIKRILRCHPWSCGGVDEP